MRGRWVFISAFFNSIVVVNCYPWALISFYKSYLEDRERKISQANVKLMVDVDQLDQPTVHNAVCNRQLNNREPNSSVSLINVQ